MSILRTFLTFENRSKRRAIGAPSPSNASRRADRALARIAQNLAFAFPACVHNLPQCEQAIWCVTVQVGKRFRAKRISAIHIWKL